jgi:hypothetical protein
MDAYGKVALVVIICFFIAAGFAMRYLAKSTPRWTVLAISLAIYALSFTFNPGRSRELVGLVGILRMVGLVGTIYGITVFRKKAKEETN